MLADALTRPNKTGEELMKAIRLDSLQIKSQAEQRSQALSNYSQAHGDMGTDSERTNRRHPQDSDLGVHIIISRDGSRRIQGIREHRNVQDLNKM